MKGLGISNVANMKAVQEICLVALNFYYPSPVMEYEFKNVSDD